MMTRRSLLVSAAASLVAATCFFRPAHAGGFGSATCAGAAGSACAASASAGYGAAQAFVPVAIPAQAQTVTTHVVQAVPVQAVRQVQRTYVASVPTNVQAVAVPVQANVYGSANVAVNAAAVGGYGNGFGVANRAGLFGGARGNRTVTKTRTVTKSTGSGLIGRVLGR